MRLRGNRSNRTSYRHALELLLDPVPDEPELTLAGSLIRYISTLSSAELNTILWVTPELDVGAGSHKALRVYPIAVRSEHQSSVLRLHERLLEDARAWEKITRDEGWLTLSDVMDRVGFSTEFFTDLSVQVYVVVPEKLNWKIPKWKQQWEEFRNGSLAFIHSSSVKSTSASANYCLSHIRLDRPLPLRRVCSRGGDFSRFMTWLSGIANTFPEGYLYAGFEHIKRGTTRLWAGLRPDVDSRGIRAAWRLSDLLHHQFLELIQETVAPPLEILWERTQDLTHAALDGGVDKVGQPALREFLGLSAEEQWPYGLTDDQIREALKALCSDKSCIRTKGAKPLTVLGAFLLLLGAVAHRMGSCTGQNFAATVESGAHGFFKPLVPVQYSAVARQTGQALFTMFAELVAEGQRCNLTAVSVKPNSLTIRLRFDPLRRGSEFKANLAEALGNRLAYQLGHRRQRSSQWGSTAEGIINYWLHANTRTDRVDEDGPIFPPTQSLRIECDADELLLTLEAP